MHAQSTSQNVVKCSVCALIQARMLAADLQHIDVRLHTLPFACMPACHTIVT